MILAFSGNPRGGAALGAGHHHRARAALHEPPARAVRWGGPGSVIPVTRPG